MQKHLPYSRHWLRLVAAEVLWEPGDFELRQAYLADKTAAGVEFDAALTTLEQSLLPLRILEELTPKLWDIERTVRQNFEAIGDVFEAVYEGLFEAVSISSYATEFRPVGIAACDLDAVVKAIGKAKPDPEKITAAVQAVFDDHLALTVLSDQEIKLTQGIVTGNVRFVRTLTKQYGLYPTECAVIQQGILLRKQAHLPDDATAGLSVVNRFKSKNKAVIMETGGSQPRRLTLAAGETATLKHSELRASAWKFVVQRLPKPKPPLEPL